MSARTRASVSPRQSPSALILASISSEGETRRLCPRSRRSSSWLLCFRHGRWPFTSVRRAACWPASPSRRTGPRRAGRPRGCRDSARPSAWTRRAATGRSDAPRKKVTFTYFVEADGSRGTSPGPRCRRSGEFHFTALLHAGHGAHDQRVEAAADARFSSPAWRRCRPAPARRHSPWRSADCRPRAACRVGAICEASSWRAWQRSSSRPSPAS